ncbi:MAG: hypothetical protein GF344_14660 [Chitinivibrionales bacterium]|nr:hypothetical protein [Chitinivibrionales bacterium]MBD3357960.1 hypothetical protein [Chitinivibrionales bacterium]
MVLTEHRRPKRLRPINAWGRVLCVGAAFAIICGCDRYPLDTGDRELLELERVWQYMRVFSIYTDRVPNHETALSVRYPEELVAMLRDTLHSPGSSIAQYYGVYTRDYADLLPAETGMKKSRSRAASSSVDAYKLTNEVAYIRIASFEGDTRRRLEDMATTIDGCPSLIIDLINNGGGDLDGCSSAVDLFLPAGITYLTTTYRQNIYTTGDTGTIANKRWRSRRSNDLFEDKQVVLLVNQGSASAAEIFAVALRDGMGADSCTIAGETTLGKSIGQYVFRLFSGAGLKLTGFRFFRTDGSDWNEKGIAPDIVLEKIDPTYLAAADVRNWILAAGELLQPNFTTPGTRATIASIVAETHLYKMPHHASSNTPVADVIVPPKEKPPLSRLNDAY